MREVGMDRSKTARITPRKAITKMHSLISDSVLRGIEQGILGLLIALGIACVVIFFLRYKAVGKAREEATPWLDKLSRAMTEDMGSMSAPVPGMQISSAERLVRVGLANSALCPDALEKLLETQETREKEILERGAQFLGTVGANAPFLGLTGTVLGILSAFRQMATAGGAGGVEVMAAIAGALVATAAGLCVAIPAVVLYNVLKARIRKTMNTLGEIRGLLMARSLQAVAKEVF
jgi:biopolymer transport protein ExbB